MIIQFEFSKCIFKFIKIALPRKILKNHESTMKGSDYRVNQLILSLASLKNVPLDTPIIETASVFVISCFIFLISCN